MSEPKFPHEFADQRIVKTDTGYAVRFFEVDKDGKETETADYELSHFGQPARSLYEEVIRLVEGNPKPPKADDDKKQQAPAPQIPWMWGLHP
jgi:hypothetical protein